jgi:hypothetical protein
MTGDDVKIAEDVIATLKKVRVASIADAKRELAKLVPKIRDTEGVQQAETFAAVQRLRWMLDEHPTGTPPPVFWDEAIAKAEEWLSRLRARRVLDEEP